MSSYVIYGDIHGCLEEWDELRKIVPKADYEVSVGDLIDRGPYKNEVIEYARKNNILAVLGNHEYKHIRKYQGRNVKLDENQKEVYPTLTKEDFEYISKMPLYIKDKNLTILHAGINNKMDLSNPYNITHLLYFRDLDENENFLALKHNNPNAKYWAEVYNGKNGFIVHGHQPFKEVKRYKYSLGIDTGCVFGNKLSAVYIKDSAKPDEYEIFSVPSKKQYATYFKELQ